MTIAASTGRDSSSGERLALARTGGEPYGQGGQLALDAEAEIVGTVNALRARFDYVFTTGGIGPTHDDITAAAVAKVGDVLDAVRRSSLTIIDLATSEADLEELFIRLTGKSAES